MLACPNRRCTNLISTPRSISNVAAVCLNICGVTRAFNPVHRTRRCSLSLMHCGVRFFPRWFRNNGAPGPSNFIRFRTSRPSCSRTRAFVTITTRSFEPFPVTLISPVFGLTSDNRSEHNSAIRRPVAASNERARCVVGGPSGDLADPPLADLRIMLSASREIAFGRWRGVRIFSFNAEKVCVASSSFIARKKPRMADNLRLTVDTFYAGFSAIRFRLD